MDLHDYARDTMTGTPEVWRERLEALARLGVEEFIVSAGSAPFAVFDWSMVELLAAVVIPSARML